MNSSSALRIGIAVSPQRSVPPPSSTIAICGVPVRFSATGFSAVRRVNEKYCVWSAPITTRSSPQSPLRSSFGSMR